MHDKLKPKAEIKVKMKFMLSIITFSISALILLLFIRNKKRFTKGKISITPTIIVLKRWYNSKSNENQLIITNIDNNTYLVRIRIVHITVSITYNSVLDSELSQSVSTGLALRKADFIIPNLTDNESKTLIKEVNFLTKLYGGRISINKNRMSWTEPLIQPEEKIMTILEQISWRCPVED